MRPRKLSPVFVILLTVIATSLHQVSCAFVSSLVDSFSEMNALETIGIKNTAALIELRGFKAETHEVITDTYVLNLVRGTNPLINGGTSGLANKSVVLFIHGVSTNANCFLVNSRGVKPKNLSRYNASTMSETELRELLANEPSIDSLPFLLMNFGHEVWMLNRRGTQFSLGRTNGRNASIGQISAEGQAKVISDFNNVINRFDLTSSNSTQIFTVFTDALAAIIQTTSSAVNSDYWNYSFDEQSKSDFFNVVNYVKEKTNGRKVSIVGHSAGGAIPLMALTMDPDFDDNLGELVLWAPAVNLAHQLVERLRYSLVAPLFDNYVGPFIPLFVIPILDGVIDVVCSNPLTQHTLCQLVANAIFGPEALNQLILPGFINPILDGVSGYDIEQLTQNIKFNGVQHYFKFGQTQQNIDAYGSELPPAYDFTKIKSQKLSLYAGITDGLVGPADVQSLKDALIVKADFRICTGSDGFFNHLSFLINNNTGTVINVPSLIKLERSL